MKIQVFISHDPHRSAEKFNLNSAEQLIEFLQEGHDLSQPQTITIQIYEEEEKHN